MFGSAKSRSRREDIRKNRPDARVDWQKLKSDGVPAAVGIAALFWVVAAGVLMFREDVVPYRPDQWIPHDVVSRVDFKFTDKRRLADAQRVARDSEPRVYAARGDVWAELERELLALPERVANASPSGQLPPDLAGILDEGAATALRQYATEGGRGSYANRVAAYVAALREHKVQAAGGGRVKLLVLPDDERTADVRARRPVLLAGEGPPFDPNLTYSPRQEEFRNLLTAFSQRHFMLALQPKVVDFTLAKLQPTHELDALATTEAQNRAGRVIPRTAAEVFYPANATLVHKSKGVFTQDDWQLLRAENDAYLESVPGRAVKTRVGIAGLVLLLTLVLAGYVYHFQPRIVRNPARGFALACLLLLMLIPAQVAGIGPWPLYLFGLAPTLLVAMILAIAYDQRFAIGVSSMHALLVTLALGQGAAFFVILWVGVLTACYLLDDVRTRSKLIEVAGAAAVAMIAATAAASTLSLDPVKFVLKNCMFAGLAGLAVGSVMSWVLPLIEKAFRITTSMTLLELADGSHPLLRRLAVEAPGTYSHSLQVATLAESAAEAIGANALLCRVGSYYHDVGKIRKADYFIENCSGGENRHLNLSPSVSLLVIIGHVKDGAELAREYNLPTSLVNFIQQHHGTTLVEYFYHQACTRQEQGQPDQPAGGKALPAVSETQYRYPGPKPRSKECAIVMLADACESACRAMNDPNASRVETLVHELAMRRLTDGQFDECDLTMRDLERIERSMVKTLLSIYHGRIAYPTRTPAPAAPSVAAPAAVRSA